MVNIHSCLSLAKQGRIMACPSGFGKYRCHYVTSNSRASFIDLHQHKRYIDHSQRAHPRTTRATNKQSIHMTWRRITTANLFIHQRHQIVNGEGMDYFWLSSTSFMTQSIKSNHSIPASLRWSFPLSVRRASGTFPTSFPQHPPSIYFLREIPDPKQAPIDSFDVWSSVSSLAMGFSTMGFLPEGMDTLMDR